MTSLRTTFLVLALGACLAAAGCGGGDDEGAPIPGDQAQALLRQLDNVEARLEQGSVGACRDVFEHPESPNRPAVDELVAQVPDDVDPEVRSALQRSFDRLWDLVEQECSDREPEEEPEPEPEPEPTPTETETTPTETETETTPTTPEEQELPPEGDGDNEGLVPGEENGGGVGPSKAKNPKEAK
jgi:hypothetical protein